MTESKDRDSWAEKRVARMIPETSWIINVKPSRDP